MGFALSVVTFFPHSLTAQVAIAPAPSVCDTDGHVQFICMPAPAEDLVPIPSTDWILASSYGGKGGIQLVDSRHKTITALYPAAGAMDRFDHKTYDTCPGPLGIEAKAKFITHGLALGPPRDGRYTLYVVYHEERESVEAFELDVRGRMPSLTWIGCAVAPPHVRLNSVVGLSDGRFIATKFRAHHGYPGFPARQHQASC